MLSTLNAKIVLTFFNGRFADSSHHTDQRALVRALLRHRDYFALIAEEMPEAKAEWDAEAAEDARVDNCLLSKYSFLRACALHVAYDNGMINRFSTEGEWLAAQDSVLASTDAQDLHRLEEWLRTLSPEERETVSVGGRDEPEVIALTSLCPTGGPDSRPLIDILDDMFENEDS